MTEDKARKIFNEEMPFRVIERIEKRRNGYLIVAYGREVGPLDVSGTVFFVDMFGNVRKLSISEIIKML